MFQKTGYDTKSLFSNLALGIIAGTDTAIWCYTYATIIFSGVLSVFIPVGLIVILCGWAILILFVIAMSKLKTHMVAIDEQAIIIIGSIGTLLIADMGEGASSKAGLATMLAVMSISSISVSISFYLVGRFRISRLLELIPYPVVCGFMVGVAWLFLDAGVMMATETPISPGLWQALQEGNNLLKLMLSLGGAVALIWLTQRIDGSWVLPVASTALIAGFYGVVAWTGATKENLVAGGWLFDINADLGGIGEMLGELSITHVDVGFIISVIPQFATLVFLAMLGAAMNISTLTAVNFKTQIRSSDEMKNNSGGNLLCAFVCSPPGFTDAISTMIYERFGASSRWMPIASSIVLLLAVPMGIEAVSFMPTVFVGATIFLFVFQMSYEWLYKNIRKFGLADYFIVCFILIFVITFGVFEGILAGIFLTALLFVFRYSMISAIQGQYTLDDHRSSVERSTSSNETLNDHGSEAQVLTLRGFLFFGTTNSIRDAITRIINKGGCSMILLDIRRVTGIDVSALKTFQQTKQLCAANNIQLLYSGVPKKSVDELLAMGAVSERNGEPLIFSATDLAIESMEETLLVKYAEETITGSIHEHLVDILGSKEKAQLILDLMERVEISAGEYLFHQDEPDNGFFMLETGSLSAMIGDRDGKSIRVKKFSPGSLIGELSSYTTEKKRTASIVADEPSVLYHLNPARLTEGSSGTTEAMSIIHELVARTLSNRIAYMNRRLLMETL